jgi:predicted ATPase/class 3 adenylate cyclase
MPDREDESTRLEMAHVLFMDLVGYSRLPLEEQNRSIAALQDIVRGLRTYQQAEAEDALLSHPAGDGMALAFFHDPSAPAQCALEIAAAVSTRGDLPLRMGIHSGPVYRAEDINRAANVRGPGINLAQRVMDCGDTGHVLLSYTTADALLPLAAWQDRLHDLGEVEVKHGLRIRLYRLTDGSVGAEATPVRVRELREQWSAEHRRHNLPASLTSFIGREEQIKEVKERLRETRLLTLTGSGGAGKTRLSMRVGEEVVDEYPDGVWFVELASISDPGLIVNAVAAVLDVRESAEQSLMETLTRYLTDQDALLILDNCEHLIEGAARFAQEFLTACPGPTVLATSREILGVNGEATWRVPSLSLPAIADELHDDDSAEHGDSEAVQLFLDRARAARADFLLNDSNQETVAAICRRLDGIPLAIELAAARVRAMSVEQIHERLDDRFRLLTGGGRASPRRQQTLRALIDWSYRLLDEAEQKLFCRLAVFQGGFTMEAAEDVCAFGGVESWDVMDLLLQMVDKSLVIAEDGRSGARYRMLETLREYGLERIVDADETRGRHATHFLGMASQLRDEFEGPTQVHAFDLLEDDHDNVRAALTWGWRGNRELGLAAVVHLHWFWHERGYWIEGQEWRELYRRDRTGLPRSLVAHALVGGAFTLLFLLQIERAREWAEEAQGIFEEQGDQAGIARVQYTLGYITRSAGDGPAVALSHLENALERARASGDRVAITHILVGIGDCLFVSDNLDRGARINAEARSLALEIKNVSAVSYLAFQHGCIEAARGDFDHAEELLDAAFALHRAIRSPHHELYNRTHRGMLSAYRGDYVPPTRITPVVSPCADV